MNKNSDILELDAQFKLFTNPNNKHWSDESVLLALIVKKLGKNGIVEFDFKDTDMPHSLNINIKNGKVFIYAE